jgi:hypothetical protein
MERTGTKLWTITVAGGEGDVVQIEINEHNKLSKLLREGLHALYGNPPPDPDGYDLLIAGTPQDNLELTLVEAGLADASEVTILPKDVSRG